ncbi:hypothetical protein GCM10025866_25180 [Naasia aerilata]|uniref:Aminotransferase class IV n=1 Tax=Naasia aerilata TaxID=1162966 RepID=A0ABM8GE85_9MICO|nr:aminotransferase class IV [Naasia aerilata]BDZ46609.1 hypothetical protein GCM10025866_25180 [Naasia aerilata]
MPGVKGPDLEALLRARSAVAADGADDGVLLAADGSVADGTTSALLWWRGDRLSIPAHDLPRVASVTAAAVLALAAAEGVPVIGEHARPADLDGLEVWTANAVHGIRGVGRWIGGPAVSSVPGRLDVWRRRLEAQRRPIRPAAAGTTLP